MESAISPIIRSKTGGISNTNNYRPIALVTACLKNELYLIIMHFTTILTTSQNQSGFKRHHSISTDQCIFLTKTTTKLYTQYSSPVYSCFLDASKAFDKINPWSLYKTNVQFHLGYYVSRYFCMGLMCYVL